MPSEAKVAAVDELTRVLEGATSIFLTDFTGMTVQMMSDLRRKCREADVEYRVVKDSLTKLAAKRAGVEDVVGFMDGPTGLALGHSDQLAPARVLIEFARQYKLPRLKGAFVEGKMLDEKQTKVLAVLPSREVLLAQFAAGLMAPLTGFVAGINQVVWKLVATLDAVAKSMDEDGASGHEAEPKVEDLAAGSTASEGDAEPKAEVAPVVEPGESSEKQG